MARLSDKLRSVERGIVHWCPGCHSAHTIMVAGPVNWTWDGDVDNPTCQPSVKITWGDGRCCHYFLRLGYIDFCADCTHELAGATVELPLWPYVDGEYGGV